MIQSPNVGFLRGGFDRGEEFVKLGNDARDGGGGGSELTDFWSDRTLRLETGFAK